MTRELELAWAGGLFEGEGSFYLRKGVHSPSVHLAASLVMADEEIVREFTRVIELGWYTHNQRRLQRPHHSPTWRWQANGAIVKEVYGLLSPWLGTRRRQRYAEILAAREEWEARTRYCRSGRHELSAVGQYSDGKCKPCARERERERKLAKRLVTAQRLP